MNDIEVMTERRDENREQILALKEIIDFMGGEE
jgi:hypothetical protein